MNNRAEHKYLSQLLSFRLDPALRTAILIYLMIRIISAVAATWVVQTAPPKIDWKRQPIYDLHEVAFTTQGPVRDWLEPWYRWDTGWYINIAYDGYQKGEGSIIFAPLYPWSMRAVAPLVGDDYLLAGLIVSNIACIVALTLLYKLVAADYGDLIAQQTVLLYMVFPTAFYLVAAYTESLFLALALGAWLAVRRDRYLLAGLVAFFASLTRSQGWILALPFAYMLYIQPTGKLPDLKKPLPLVKRMPAVIGGPLGTALYLFGMRFAGLGSIEQAFKQPPWQTNVVMPWTTLAKTIRVIIEGPVHDIDLANIAALIFVVILAAVVTIRLRKPEYWLYIWPTLLFILLRDHYLIVLHGMLRYVIDMFPIFIALALVLRGSSRLKRVARVLYVIISFGIQVLLVTLFAEWLWVA